MAARAAAAAALLPANLAAKDFWDFSAAAFMAFWFLALVAARAFMAVAMALDLALPAAMALALAAISFLYLARRRPEAALAAADSWAMAFWIPCIFFWKAACFFISFFSATAASCISLMDLAVSAMSALRADLTPPSMDLAAERCFLFRARALARKPASFLAHFFSTAAAAAAALPLAPAAALACLVDLSLTTALTRPLWSLPVLASAALWAALSALLAAACLALTSFMLDFWRKTPPSSPEAIPEARDFTMVQTEPAPRFALKRP